MAIKIKLPKNAIKAGKEKMKQAGGIELPPGVYPAAITDIKEVQDKLVFELVVGGDVDPEAHGAKISIWYGFDENQIGFFFRALSAMGIDVSDIETSQDINEAVEEVLEAQPVVKVKCKHKGGYCNYEIQSVIDDMDYADLELDDEEEEEEDEKPKKRSSNKTKRKEEDDEDEEEDELDDMSRLELKKFVKENELDITIKKSMSDDDIRTLIRKEVD